ncbi:glycosyl transferase family 90 [Halobacteriovorax sp. ZH1_bin.1]|uniref:glycosyl transferase family 90 n=1 Tax=Halobacteriovorax sp. ZH1_bin.1 TaxID=3157723 RepID=UPI003711978E
MKQIYYIKNALNWFVPKFIYERKAQQLLAAYEKSKDSYIEDRLNYYNKLESDFSLPEDENQNNKIKNIPRTFRIKDFKKMDGTTYYFDILDIIKYFPKNLKFRYISGDVTDVPELPSIVKSRPVANNQNSVLLKLNKVRHFKFISDALSFEEKKDIAVWRGANLVPHRQVVVEQFYNHPLCDIGQTTPIEGNPWEKGFLSIDEQLKNKFILCIEGNDVATNLKWVMSSNSVAVMSKPKYETWFMEGRLVAGKHYVEVKDDYSDLPEKIAYYTANPEEAKAIIKNAHAWVDQFKDEERELLISLLVANKYFDLQ